MNVTRKTRVIAAGVLLAGVGATALADKVVLDGGPGYGGGAFNATITLESGSPFGSSGTVLTKTFCVETQSYFNPGTQYFVEYSNSATPGGGGASGGQDPLGYDTAWLFSRAMMGALSWNLNDGNGVVAFDINNATHERAMQEAIWQLENEVWGSYSSASSTVGKIRDNIKAQAAAHAADGTYYGVAVMRLWDTRTGTPGNYTYSGDHQDQIVLIPLPPAAWAGLSMMAGVVGMAYIRRRKQIA
jgi:hypothetical protein